MTKVIDALVVTLGLDPSGYKKGVEEAKAAETDLKKTAQSSATSTQTAVTKTGKVERALAAEKRKQAAEEKKLAREKERQQRDAQTQEARAAEATVGRLKSIGFAVAGAVIGFNSIKGALSAYLETTNQMANLGRVAPTVGTDVKALDVLGDMYKQVGGDAKDAAADIGKLAHAQFSFAVNAPDAMAGWLRRLGVGLFDTNTGQARSKEAIQEDIARALKEKTKDLQTQAMYAREMGLSESFIQLYLMKESSERAKIRKDAEKTAQANEKSAAQAVKEEQARSRIGNALKGLKERVVTAVSPKLAHAENIVADLLEGDTTSFKSATTRFKGGSGIATAKFDPKAAPYNSLFEAAERKYNLPIGILAAIAKQESNFNPNAVNKKSGARGLMQLMPQFFPNAGKSVSGDIDTAAKELQARLKYRQSQGFTGKQLLDLALADYNNGVGKNNKLISSGGKAPAETRNYVPAVEQYAGMLSNTAASQGGSQTSNSTVNNIHIDQLSVHTQAKDAKEIAATLPDAIKNQGLVAQANTGQF